MPAPPIEEIGSRATIFEPKGIREGLVTTGWMWDEQDEATLNPYDLIGYELVALTTVTATGRLVAYLKRGTLPENDEMERP